MIRSRDSGDFLGLRNWSEYDGLLGVVWGKVDSWITNGAVDGRGRRIGPRRR